MARRPRSTVMCSSTSAMSTKRTMTTAVNASRMESAATSAIVIDSSIVIRRSRRAATASL